MAVALGLELRRRERVAHGQGGQADLLVLELGVGIVGALHVGPQEPGKLIVLPLVANSASSPADDTPAQAHLDALAPGVGHLRGDRPLPDQVVEAELVAVQAGAARASGTSRPPGRIASWASWAFLTFLSYRRGEPGTYSAP